MLVDYPSPMIKQALVVVYVLASSQLAQADIYRWVDPKGHTHFSDRRPAEAAAQVLPPEADQGDSAMTDGSETRESADLQPSLGPYDAFDILAPSAGTVLVQPTDTLAVRLLLEPPLQEGHRLELVNNGRPAVLEPGVTQVQMEAVGFGPHHLQLRVKDSLGATVAATPVHELELREATPPGILP